MGHPGCFIVPFNPIDGFEDEPFFALEQDIFAQSLKVRWADVRISRAKIPNSSSTSNQPVSFRYELAWNIPGEHGKPLYGQHNTGSALTLEAYPRDLAVEFVKWYREIVPQHIPLYLGTIVMENALLLTNETTSDEIIKAMGTSLD